MRMSTGVAPLEVVGLFKWGKGFLFFFYLVEKKKALQGRHFLHRLQ